MKSECRLLKKDATRFLNLQAELRLHSGSNLGPDSVKTKTASEHSLDLLQVVRIKHFRREVLKTETLAWSGLNLPFSKTLGLLVSTGGGTLGSALHLAEDAHQVTAQDLAQVVGTVSAIHQRCRNLRQVSR
jgi:hypothetical protein